jgi:hypothetical protein
MYVRERNLCQSGRLKFKVLAPSRQEVPKSVTHDVLSGQEHSEVMFDLQKLRGHIYREYAGIASTLLPDGRHWHRLDNASWHIVLQDSNDKVIGCARYRRISIFDELICSKAAVALSTETGPIFRTAFEQQVAGARKRGLHYGEASAWALSEQARCSTAAINIALMSFALAEWLGGGVGLTTASTRHHASSMLRRIGGEPLAGFKPYYEPMFDCDIELLQFDIDNLQPRYSVKLDDMRAQLRITPIICPFESLEDNTMGQVPHFLTATNQPAQPALSQMQ